MMDRVEVTRDGDSNRYSVVLARGGDTLRCMIAVPTGSSEAPYSDEEKRRAALCGAKALARALDMAINDC